MQSVLPSCLKTEFTTFWEGPFDGQGIDVDGLDGLDLFPWQIESTNTWWSRPLKKGEIACSLVHLECWRRAWESGHTMVLILEDDVVFSQSFQEDLSSGLAYLATYSLDWDMVYLGRLPIGPDTPISRRLVIPGYSHCTYAYLLGRRAIWTFINAGLERALIPVDEFLPAMYCDHPRSDIRRRFPKSISAFAFDPPLVLQLPKSVAGSDTEGTDFIDGAWMRHPGAAAGGHDARVSPRPALKRAEPLLTIRRET